MQLASGTVKPVTLELGGKSANIVLDDADLDIAAAGVLWGTFFHNGQVCESGTRALVHAGHLRRVRRPARRPRRQDRHRRPAWTWPPTSARWCRRSQVETVERYVKLGRDEVRRAHRAAARKPDGLPDGLDADALLPPDDLRRRRQLDEDRPGGDLRPGAVRHPVRLRRRGGQAIANDSIYGLGGGVRVEQHRPGARASPTGMRTGTVWINDYHMITPERPFGGYKQSGIGRELGDVRLRRVPPGQARLARTPSTDRDGYIHFAALSGNI